MIRMITTAALATCLLMAPIQAASWETDYGKALSATRGNNKPLLIVLDIPSESEKSLSVNQLSESKTNASALASYQLCHVDVSTPYGKSVAKAFQVSTFPHVAIIDKTGSNVIAKKSGKLSSEQFANLLVENQQGAARHVVMKPIANMPTANSSVIYSSGTMSGSSCGGTSTGYVSPSYSSCGGSIQGPVYSGGFSGKYTAQVDNANYQPSYSTPAVIPAATYAPPAVQPYVAPLYDPNYCPSCQKNPFGY